MTTIVGLTGGIASGKTTIINFLRKKKIPTHDSDAYVRNIYSKPTTNFINYLKKIKLESSLKNKKIDKTIIREEIFNNLRKRKKLEKYIHLEIKKLRDKFLIKHKQKKTNIVFLDIPLLFENKLEKICDYTILLYAPRKIRKKRAIKRKGMEKSILNKIINNQLSDSVKKNKADFIINTSFKKKNSYKKILEIISKIMKNNYA